MSGPRLGVSSRARISGIVVGVVGAICGVGYTLGVITAPRPVPIPEPFALASTATKAPMVPVVPVVPAAPSATRVSSPKAVADGARAGAPGAEAPVHPALTAGSGPAESTSIPLAWRTPVTGPGRPPLPEDANGPFGSWRNTGTYEVALTFDDGPDPQWTPQVLELLRLYRVKATFCLIGVNVVEFPYLVQQIAAEGHTLCNHSWVHDLGLGNRSYSAILADMQRTNDAIHAAVPGAKISYFRHPGGMWTEPAVSAAKSLGMTSLHWDVDPKDWLKPGARAIASVVNNSTIPGAIVLMHDGGGDRRGTTEALRSILPNLTARFPLVAMPAGVDPPRKYGLQLPVHLGQL